MGKDKSKLGNPVNRPCAKFLMKIKHTAHHHTDSGYSYCDGYPDPLKRQNYGQ